MRRLFILAAALVVGLSAQDAFAQRVGDRDRDRDRDRAVDVDCPAERIETGLSVDLPRGWRAPTDRGRLVDTRVQRDDGRAVLECGYDLFGTTIWLRADQPEQARECTARRGGFVCEGRRRDRDRDEDGAFSLTGDASFDLDQGLRGSGSPDIYLQRRGSLKQAIDAAGDAQIALIGRAADFELRDCADARYGRGRIDVDVLQPGTKLCVQTNEGRDALLTVAGLEIRLFGRSTISFVYEIDRRRR